MKYGIVICLLLAACYAHAIPSKQSQVANSNSVTSDLRLQILLDRAGFSSGEIDGKYGTNVSRAVTAFQESSQLPTTGKGDQATLAALGDSQLEEPLVDYVITEKDVAGPFSPPIPADKMEQAKLPRLGYTSPVEKLAEKFHCNPDLIRQFNPQAQFSAGETIKVPNINPMGGPQTQNAQSAQSKSQSPNEVVVSQSDDNVVARDASGKIVFYAAATVGSDRDPIPPGEWKVMGVSFNPVFFYHPELFWDSSPTDSKAKIAPGPNNPVGLVWIETNAPHYGLHGTPEPGKIGHSESHGCIRMTNWDALRLASMVKPGTRLIFQ